MPWSLTWVRALSCLSCLSCLTMQRKTLDLQKQEMVVWFFTLSTWAIWKGRIEGILWRTSEANDCTSEAGGSAAGVCWNCMVGDLETGWRWSGQKHMISLKQGRNQAAVQFVYSINLCKYVAITTSLHGLHPAFDWWNAFVDSVPWETGRSTSKVAIALIMDCCWWLMWVYVGKTIINHPKWVVYYCFNHIP